MASEHAATAAEVAAILASAGLDEIDELARRYADDPRQQVQKAIVSALKRKERQEAEHERVLSMYRLMREMGGEGMVLGIDEVGRGAVAGPLTVAAVALPDDPVIWGINDSKQLSPERRTVLATRIEQVALAVGIAHVEPAYIDRHGMALALRTAMLEALANSGVEPDAVLIDGNPVGVHPREQTIVKGDAKVACIAAASIVAKVTRDALMVELAQTYPGYHLDECKGYASATHIQAIKELGLSPLHRVSFCGNFLANETLF